MRIKLKLKKFQSKLTEKRTYNIKDYVVYPKAWGRENSCS